MDDINKLIEAIPGNTAGDKLQWLLETLQEVDAIDVRELIKRGCSSTNRVQGGLIFNKEMIERAVSEDERIEKDIEATRSMYSYPKSPSIGQSLLEAHFPPHKWKIMPKKTTIPEGDYTFGKHIIGGIDLAGDSSEDKSVEVYFSPPLGCPTTFMISRMSLKHTPSNNKQESNFVEVMKKNDLENLDNIFKSTFPDSKQ